RRHYPVPRYPLPPAFQLHRFNTTLHPQHHPLSLHDALPITSLTFQKNDAEQAMNFYVSLFENSEILNIQRWGKEGPGKEGSIMQATFLLNGKLFICSDSPPVHDWDFTPAFSNYVECQNEVEFQRFYSKLAENGKIAMPADNYGFSKKFAWVIDSFGVSWQLNLK